MVLLSSLEGRAEQLSASKARPKQPVEKQDPLSMRQGSPTHPGPPTWQAADCLSPRRSSRSPPGNGLGVLVLSSEACGDVT